MTAIQPVPITIQMMDSFVITCGGQVYDSLAAKSRRGVILLQYLILLRGKVAPVQRLIRELWSDHRSEYPEAALKTMISRTRQWLREIHPDLAECLVSGKGGYCWQSRPNVSVDVIEIMDIFDALEHMPPREEYARLTERLLKLYKGDICHAADIASGVSQSNYLHMSYLSTVCQYISILKESESYNRICDVCHTAMQIDDLDEQLYIELMNALVHLNRTEDALRMYQKAEKINYRYFDAPPGQDLSAYYHELSTTAQTVQFNLDAIRNELIEREGERRGPFVCDYNAFREFYNIEMRNLERLGSTMFLAVIMVGEKEHPVAMEAGVAGLMAILRTNLRKGDIVTRYSDNIIAMLLPTVNYTSGSMVMDRIEQLFRSEYPQSDIAFHARIAPLGDPLSHND